MHEGANPHCKRPPFRIGAHSGAPQSRNSDATQMHRRTEARCTAGGGRLSACQISVEMTDPDFDTTAFIAPMTAAQSEARIKWETQVIREHSDRYGWRGEEWIEDALREERREAVLAALAKAPLPQVTIEALATDVATGKIITAARFLCAATDPELLPGLDGAILAHDADGTLRELGDKLGRELESNLLATVILQFEPC
jgi:hypothetical protein